MQTCLIIIYPKISNAYPGVLWSFNVKSGTIQYAEREVFLDSRPLQLPQGGYLQMENGQTLQTRRGRLEILMHLPDLH